MNLYRKYRFAVAGVVVSCASVGSAALTLGHAQGVVLLGQSLKLTVPVRVGAEEGASSLCFEADIFYGDTRQDSSRVEVSTEFPTQPQMANVYVTAHANVDEPVVTVYLRSGCAYKTTRRYVLLAELATEAAAPMSGSGALRRSSASVAVPAPWTASVGGDASTAAKPSVRAVVAKSVERPAMAAAPKLNAQGIEKRHPHLKLAPVELTIDRDPILKLSNEMLMGKSENLQQRGEAAALWRSLNATPQEALLADSRRQSMETDMKGLHEATNKNRLLLQELSHRLERAESERYSNPVLYGLAALLLASSLGLAHAWRRLRRVGLVSSPWWHRDGVSNGTEPVPSSDDGDYPREDSDPGFARSFDAFPTLPPEVSADNAVPGQQEVDVDLNLDDSHDPVLEQALTRDASEPLPVSTVRMRPGATGHADFTHSVAASLRSLNTQEMPDVRQQAEFFMTLGQHEAAIGMLKDSVNGSADSNPLVYLDLLKVLHTLGRKAEYDDYRDDFNALFSGHVPSYAEFNFGGEGLEAYPDVCQVISQHWPAQEAVAYIEKCLVRKQDEGRDQRFDLEAFRDLLMLHGVARRIASSSDSRLQPFSAHREPAAESDADHSDRSVGGVFVSDATQPIEKSAGQAVSMTLDLDLSEPSGNLIDFDAQDLFLSKSGNTPKSE